MFRNRICLAAMIILCLVPVQALATSANLISEDLIVSNTVNYDTIKVEMGSISQTFDIGGDIYLPYTYELCPEVGGLMFEEYTVEAGEMVKEGDILAVFSSNVDEVALEEQQLLLKRTREAYRIEKAERQAQIDEMYMSMPDVRDSYDLRMLKLKLQRAELAFEQYIFQTENNIAAIERRIRDYEDQREDCYIKAPVDGLVMKTLTKRPGNRIANDEVMVIMCRTDGALVEVKNKTGNFRYGMEVMISVGNRNQQTIPGRVVGADYMLPESQQLKNVYIRPEYYDPETTPTVNIKVNTTTMQLDNVIAIPRTAVSLDAGRNYVMKYSDGMLRKRYINAFISNQKVIVLQGLEPGEEIVDD